MKGDDLVVCLGAVVRHIPSGENWVIARVSGEDVYPLGWPPTIASAKDCVILDMMTDAQKTALKDRLLRLPLGDPRRPIDAKNATDKS